MLTFCTVSEAFSTTRGRLVPALAASRRALKGCNLQRRAVERVDGEPRPFRFGQEFRVFHGLVERLAQRRDSVGRCRRVGQRPRRPQVQSIPQRPRSQHRQPH